MNSMKEALERNMDAVKVKQEQRSKVYRFDIFKGVDFSDGKVYKIRSIGSAHLIEGSKTYTVYLKTLLKDVFYLLPEQKKLTQGDYVILTREPSQTPGRKFFWNNVGECYILAGENAGIMKLCFDLFGSDNIYMNLHPINKDSEAATEDVAAKL